MSDAWETFRFQNEEGIFLNCTRKREKNQGGDSEGRRPRRSSSARAERHKKYTETPNPQEIVARKRPRKVRRAGVLAGQVRYQPNANKNLKLNTKLARNRGPKKAPRIKRIKRI